MELPNGLYAVRIKYDGMVLKCDAYRYTEANLAACYLALAVLLGEPADRATELGERLAADPNEALTIELYRSYGAA